MKLDFHSPYIPTTACRMKLKAICRTLNKLTHVKTNRKCPRSQATDFRGEEKPGLEVIKLEFILRLKIKSNDWLIADTCPQAANHCALF